MSESLIDKQVLNKSRYQPDLNEMLSQCELNYWLVKQLLPTLAKAGNQAVFDKKNEHLQLVAELVELAFKVTDIAPYTTTMKLMIKTPKTGLDHNLELIVRLYHDVQMMEVMEGSGPSAMAAIYPVINVHCKNVDEKRQINRFVGECLRACFDRGMQSRLVNTRG